MTSPNITSPPAVRRRFNFQYLIGKISMGWKVPKRQYKDKLGGKCKKNKKKLPTCKPDPVPAQIYATHRLARVAIIYLAPVLLQGSSCLPSGVASSRKHRTSRPRPPVYVAFQHARFTRAAGYPTPPWALTPRFHPHPHPQRKWRQLFSVALAVNARASPGS
jgi:hypothetical protein